MQFNKKMVCEYNKDNSFDIVTHIENLNNDYIKQIAENHNLDFLTYDRSNTFDILNDIIDFGDNVITSVLGIYRQLDSIELMLMGTKENPILKFKLTKKRCKYGNYFYYIFDKYNIYSVKGKSKYINLAKYNRDYKLMEIENIK